MASGVNTVAAASEQMSAAITAVESNASAAQAAEAARELALTAGALSESVRGFRV
ncbi:hypothetical protein [Cryptosporangium minutisporangium]|uniref:Methyl-accepting chemotaxis protein n=1 Tax=Cryptosporangium minutisporangium TaxID=113569 RepID=A0ABP6T792_9ACTN